MKEIISIRKLYLMIILFSFPILYIIYNSFNSINDIPIPFVILCVLIIISILMGGIYIMFIYKKPESNEIGKIFEKYNIKSDHDALKLLHDKNVSNEEKILIRKLLELSKKMQSK